MSDLAERLRSAREKLGVSIEEAERATKIRRRYIEAIEGGDFERLPDGPPSRGFIKNYARYLGLDPDRSLTDFESEVGVPIVQVNEVVPPPPSRTQAQSRYTQLVKLPQLRWKGDLPADEQAELDTMADPNASKQTSLGRSVFRREDPQMLPSSFSLREPKVTQASDVRPLQSGHSPFSLRNLTGGLGNEAVSQPRRMRPMSVNAPDSNNALLVIGVVIGGLVLIAALFGLIILPAAQKGAQQAAAASTPGQGIRVSIIGDSGALTQSVVLATGAVSGTIATPAANGAATPAVTNAAPTVAAAQTPAAIIAAITPTAAPASPAATPQPAVQPIPGGGVQLILDAREHAWVRVTVDGAVVYEGIPQVGPNSSWHGQNTVGIETGNAGAFDIIINNVRLGPPGERNAVAKVTWDANGKVVTNP